MSSERILRWIEQFVAWLRDALGFESDDGSEDGSDGERTDDGSDGSDGDSDGERTGDGSDGSDGDSDGERTEEGSDGSDGDSDGERTEEGSDGSEEGSDGEPADGGDGGAVGDGRPVWPSLARDRANTGFVGVAGVRSADVDWTTDLGDRAYGGPVVADGTVYASGDSLAALDATSGEPIWTGGLGQAGEPLLRGGTVYVGGRQSIAAYDAADGTERWRVDEPGRTLGYADGTVLAVTETGLLALSSDGDELWTREYEAPPHYSTVASPAVADETVFVGGYDGQVHALDSTDGSVRWRFAVPDRDSAGEGVVSTDVTGTPAVADGTVLAGTGGGFLFAVDASTGERRWEYRLGSTVHTAPGVTDGRVFAPNGDGEIVVLSLDDGSVVRKTEATFGDPQGAIAVTLDTIYAATRSGLVAAFDRDTGERVWEYETDRERPLRGGPAVGRDRVFVTDGTGTVHAIGPAAE